jgi:hypothetical protein
MSLTFIYISIGLIIYKIINLFNLKLNKLIFDSILEANIQFKRTNNINEFIKTVKPFLKFNILVILVTVLNIFWYFVCLFNYGIIEIFILIFLKLTVKNYIKETELKNETVNIINIISNIIQIFIIIFIINKYGFN